MDVRVHGRSSCYKGHPGPAQGSAAGVAGTAQHTCNVALLRLLHTLYQAQQQPVVSRTDVFAESLDISLACPCSRAVAEAMSNCFRAAVGGCPTRTVWLHVADAIY